MNDMQKVDLTEASLMKVVLATANWSGFKPTEYKILVKADDVAVVSKGGILIPIESQDSEKYKQTRGTIIAVSPLAFSYATQEEWDAVGGKPTVGDRILYARFGGVVIKGPKDGKEYTVLNDKDVIGTIEE